jgi:GLPGLI family protein
MNETKKIDSFICQKAVGNFRGRTWYAWYVKEIPVSTGPWKLHGLPGLIIEASDSLDEVKFIFESLSIPPGRNPEIPEYAGFKTYSREGFAIKQKKYEEEIKTFILSAGNGQEAYNQMQKAKQTNKQRPLELN